MMKKLLSSVREYKKNTLLAPVYVTFESILEIVIPTLMAYLIDYGINQKNMPNVLWIGLALIVCAMISLLTGVLAGRSAAVASAGFAKNLRRDMFYNVQKFSFSNIDKFSTASIITRLTTDVTNVQNAYQMLVRLGVRAPMMIVFALIFSFRIDVRLSLIFLATIPVLGVGLWLIISHVHPVFVRVFNTYDKLNRIVQENLLGIRVVKSYIREDHEEEKFADISQSIFQDFTKAEKRIAFNMPLMQLCLYASMLLLSWFGAKEIIASGNNPVIGLSTGELASLITYALQILMSLMMLSMVFVMIIIARASAERIVEVLNEESDLKNGENPLYTVQDGSIVFENVTFTYSRKADKPVLDDINLSIASGETVGILGGTGSSKSSLVQLIPRLYDVTNGKVTVGGVDVRDYDIESLRNQVAMVLQKNVLFSGTIKENLRWGNADATEEEMIHACSLAQADGFIREFPDQYDTYIEQGGTNVSGGQKQRLCIARALLKKPKILILDDSTSAVDTKTDELIRQAFRQDIPNTTKIIIAQRVSSVQDADKIIVLDDGKINAVGTHEELLGTCAIYREVYESQNRGGALHE
ncbi:ABC transporter ATP-binding protein [Clostridium sp. KNHs216]|uniref:ABC transporter ATP-binding protein n=1 Tax=Clostridium sp. KNHs216 TaxID=1550235 RepID=UPI001154B050|nr:ABC transporter ATP-binding protein [Clostridium sp. KNHs216]TQI66921.1 ATP-binding cassette subfamily B protein [Clostridium sp. KNHs216]